VGAAYGVIVSLLLRLTGFLVAIVPGLLFSYLLSRELSVKGVTTAHTRENGI